MVTDFFHSDGRLEAASAPLSAPTACDERPDVCAALDEDDPGRGSSTTDRSSDEGSGGTAEAGSASVVVDVDVEAPAEDADDPGVVPREDDATLERRAEGRLEERRIMRRHLSQPDLDVPAARADSGATDGLPSDDAPPQTDEADQPTETAEDECQDVPELDLTVTYSDGSIVELHVEAC